MDFYKYNEYLKSKQDKKGRITITVDQLDKLTSKLAEALAGRF